MRRLGHRQVPDHGSGDLIPGPISARLTGEYRSASPVDACTATQRAVCPLLRRISMRTSESRIIPQAGLHDCRDVGALRKHRSSPDRYALSIRQRRQSAALQGSPLLELPRNGHRSPHGSGPRLSGAFVLRRDQVSGVARRLDRSASASSRCTKHTSRGARQIQTRPDSGTLRDLTSAGSMCNCLVAHE